MRSTVTAPTSTALQLLASVREDALERQIEAALQEENDA
jgi:hypothetical protein